MEFARTAYLIANILYSHQKSDVCLQAARYILDSASSKFGGWQLAGLKVTGSKSEAVTPIGSFLSGWQC